MAMNLSIDLSNATFADVAALVEAGRAAGVDKHAALHLDGSTLSLSVEPSGVALRPTSRETKGPLLGDAAVRSVIDILSGRQEPPR